MSMQGAMVPKCLGAMAPWCLGALVPWRHGALVPWRHGALVPCCHDAMAPQCHGATVPWLHGATEPWCLGAMASRCLGAMAPRCQAALVPRCTDIQLDKDTTMAGHYTSIGVRHWWRLQQYTRRSQKSLIAACFHAPSPALRANSFPKLTDPFCRLPLPTLFHRPEVVHLGDLMRL
ncbi:hypothetical protein CQW23_34629 [Capsicum baccatum]|uniref:Secreted protein n=1 Tax=Capsicum baccatum TaxID=33114 RepID=A0A2G2UYJ4_CAPBA|nr:hypothetical protein CQW23_34629 [Capsicum baccatum]